jgi:NAD(P)-dependent dehydrogenase (short-subunit alcohol dehydrogenase family)
MNVKDKIVIVTGAASGIGEGLVERFHAEGAAKIVCCDIDKAGLDAIASRVDGDPQICDVSDEAQVKAVIEYTEATYGRVDLYCANAGVLPLGDLEISNEAWEKAWQVNTMSHVYAARAVVPGMIARGGGAFMCTASAAGLLGQIGSSAYSVTKHATVGFAEWLSITYGMRGIKVFALCPQAVHSKMTAGLGTDGNSAAGDGIITAAQLAESVIQAFESETFLILPHPEVATYVERKATDHQRWLGGMQRLHGKMVSENGKVVVS